MKEGKTCKICSKTFTRRNYLQKHMENIHSKRYSCPTCLRYFAGPTEHSCATKNGRFTCYVDKCSLKFANGMSLRLHVRDGHRKVDENISTGAALKTKKDARDMVKMLCRKINVLSKCFDELKYQLDNVNDFLKSMGYELPINQKTKQQTQKDEEIVEQNDDMDYDDMTEYIDELIEEVSEEEMNTFSSENIQTENIQTITLYPKTSIQPTYQIFSPPQDLENIPIISLPNEAAASLPLIQLPPVSKIGSTIISQIMPIEVNPSATIIDDKSTLTNSQIEIQGAEKNAPPLFLKIQYDTETEVCKNDPKITFHFETRPLDKNAEEKELSGPT